jgi:thiamine transport system substrate-binding protein
MCFRQVEFIGILAGTRQRDLAEKFVDKMLDIRVQEDIPMQMFVYPVNKNAVLPAEFNKFSQVPEEPASIAPGFIEANRYKILQDWTALILK